VIAVTVMDFPESDWKLFRDLRDIALERFCKRILNEVHTIVRDGSRTYHERYLDAFRLWRRRDDCDGSKRKDA
jgi:hypothetical protein